MDRSVVNVIRRGLHMSSADKQRAVGVASGKQKQEKRIVPTHTVSLFVGTLSRVEGVPKGVGLRLTIKLMLRKHKVDFDYMPGGECACVPHVCSCLYGCLCACECLVCVVVCMVASRTFHCVCVSPAVSVRCPEIQLEVPNPERQVIHMTLKTRGNPIQKRVVAIASFPLTPALGGERKELGIPLSTFDGTPCGRITLKIRVQPLGVLLENWVTLGQGVRSQWDAPPVKGSVPMPPPKPLTAPPTPKSGSDSPPPSPRGRRPSRAAAALKLEPSPVRRTTTVSFVDNPMQIALRGRLEARAKEEADPFSLSPRGSGDVSPSVSLPGTPR